MYRHPGLKGYASIIFGLLVWIFNFLRLYKLSFFYYKYKFPKGYIRVINYHSTPNRDIKILTSHFNFYNKYFSSVSMIDLDNFFERGEWNKSKPGLLITFDDGIRNNYDVALKILDKFSFHGIFFIPTNFINTHKKDQFNFATHRNINVDNVLDYNDERKAMNWDEIKILTKKHTIGCHTLNHQRMYNDLPIKKIKNEISNSKKELERKLGMDINCFAWVGGEKNTYSNAAHQIIKLNYFKYSFMTCSYPIHQETESLKIHRLWMDSGWDKNVVKFQLSGVFDLVYHFKRKYVNNITN